MSEAKPVQVVDHFTEHEKSAAASYERALATGAEAPVGSAKQAQMFELFLNGRSLTEIARLNRPLRLGAIVVAAREGDWHERKQAYVDRLLSTVVDRVYQVQAQATHFASDLLAVAHRQHGEALQRFLQTGDAKDLGEFKVKDLAQYRQAVELLLKLTGQDKERTSMPVASGKTTVTAGKPVLGAPTRLTDLEAARALAALQAPDETVVDAEIEEAK